MYGHHYRDAVRIYKGQRCSMLFQTEYTDQASEHIRPLLDSSALWWKVAASFTQSLVWSMYTQTVH